MGKVTGFKEFQRAVEPYRPAKERKLDLKRFIKLEQAELRKERAEKQRQFLEQIQDILEPKFFESDSNNWLVKEIKKYFLFEL